MKHGLFVQKLGRLPPPSAIPAALLQDRVVGQRGGHSRAHLQDALVQLLCISPFLQRRGVKLQCIVEHGPYVGRVELQNPFVQPAGRIGVARPHLLESRSGKVRLDVPWIHAAGLGEELVCPVHSASLVQEVQPSPHELRHGPPLHGVGNEAGRVSHACAPSPIRRPADAAAREWHREGGALSLLQIQPHKLGNNRCIPRAKDHLQSKHMCQTKHFQGKINIVWLEPLLLFTHQI